MKHCLNHHRNHEVFFTHHKADNLSKYTKLLAADQLGLSSTIMILSNRLLMIKRSDFRELLGTIITNLIKQVFLTRTSRSHTCHKRNEEQIKIFQNKIKIDQNKTNKLLYQIVHEPPYFLFTWFRFDPSNVINFSNSSLVFLATSWACRVSSC